MPGNTPSRPTLGGMVAHGCPWPLCMHPHNVVDPQNIYSPLLSVAEHLCLNKYGVLLCFGKSFILWFCCLWTSTLLLLMSRLCVLCRHTEDMELHSLNYLHYGAPKIWYCVAPAHKKKMDAFVAKSLYAQHDRCKDFMRHKVISTIAQMPSAAALLPSMSLSQSDAPHIPLRSFAF